MKGMGRGLTGKLKALTVARIKQPGMHSDGGGLYLHVAGSGARSWIFRYWVEYRDPATGEPMRDPVTGKVRGRSREMGLGSFATISLAQARELASEYRKVRHQGIDPIDARRAARTRAALDAARSMSFRECAESYINSHRPGWRDPKHVQQWQNTLATYAEPILGALPVQDIDTALVCRILEPIWSSKPETASRLRGRIEAILDWAKVREYRDGENPARWRGHLNKLLPAVSRVRRVKHYAALPYDEIPAFMAELRSREGTIARAFEFLVLTAARTGEVLGARWDEFDLDRAIWTVPAERMKAGREHRVPLSPVALQIIKDMAELKCSEFVFPGSISGSGLSDKVFWKLLSRMKVEGVTVHGFRSAFRDWAAERTGYPNHVVEMALAHTIGDRVEAAYRRGDLFDKRQGLMVDWARFCHMPNTSAAVVPLRANAGEAP
jgi:integrase